MNTQQDSGLALRAAAFQRVLEDVRQARAESRVLVATVGTRASPWASLTSTRSRCEQLQTGLDENHGFIGVDLSWKIERLRVRLEEALSDMTLCSLLGPEDASAREALVRARRAVEQDTARIESSIRAEMASLMMSSRAPA